VSEENNHATLDLRSSKRLYQTRRTSRTGWWAFALFCLLASASSFNAAGHESTKGHSQLPGEANNSVLGSRLSETYHATWVFISSAPGTVTADYLPGHLQPGDGNSSRPLKSRGAVCQKGDPLIDKSTRVPYQAQLQQV